MWRIRCSYQTRQNTNDTFSIELVDEEGFAFDSFNFPSGGNGVKIRTPKGYENSVEGAKDYARVVWRDVLA